MLASCSMVTFGCAVLMREIIKIDRERRRQGDFIQRIAGIFDGLRDEGEQDFNKGLMWNLNISMGLMICGKKKDIFSGLCSLFFLSGFVYIIPVYYKYFLKQEVIEDKTVPLLGILGVIVGWIGIAFRSLIDN